MTYYSDDTITLHHGDALDVLRGLPDGSVDAVCTDPPYGLEFMGKDWDGADGFRRSLNATSAARDNAFGRLSAKGPEYSTGRGVRVAQERADEMTPTGKGHATSAGPYLAARVDSVRVAGPPFQEWCQAWASECLRVLKPGGYLLAFGGSRTWHRLACAVEDAGFEIRDSIAWLYGSGFPKSLDVSKAIDKAAGAEREVVGYRKNLNRTARRADAGAFHSSEGGMFREDRDEFADTAPATEQARHWNGWGTALKPAFEPIVMARKPLAGTVAANVLEHGTGALNIAGCRVEHANADDLAASLAKNPGRGDMVTSGVYGASRPQQSVNTAGRWPTNIALDGNQADELDRQTGVSESRIGKPRGAASGEGWGMTATGAEYADTGGASRFFPVFRYEAKAPTEERPNVGGVAHPTVKPLDLMRWLVRLVTPPGGTVLEPFAGSGTTVEACIHEGFGCIAIEREADYLPLIQHRIDRAYRMANHAFNFEEPA